MSLKDRIVAIHDVFSQRKTRNTGRVLKQLAQEDRNRILLLYRDVINGSWDQGFQYHGAELLWAEVHNSLEHRLGRPILSQRLQAFGLHNHKMVADDVHIYLSECTPDEFLDFIELSFKVQHPLRSRDGSSEVIEALNEVFRQGGQPYRLTDYVKVEEEVEGVPHLNSSPYKRRVPKIVAYPRIIVVEEEVAYKEAVKPALAILGHHQFVAANTEFRDGLKHYRKESHRDCLTSCGSALESVLKVICDRNGWHYSKGATLGPLLDLVIDQLGLESVFAEKFKLLATIRNRSSSSHGGGSSPRMVDRHLAQYMVTTTAATIVFLVTEANRRQ